jgi:hypothetical protein
VDANRCSTIVDDKKRLKCFDELFSIKAPSEMPLEMMAQNPASRLSKVRHRVMAARSLALEWQ